MALRRVAFRIALAFVIATGVHADEGTAPADSVLRYHAALIAGDADALKAVLGPQVAMYNGAGSADQLDWQAHMYLSGDGLFEWADFMVTGAAPHRNELEVLSTSVRAGMALVVTRETGGNKFLSWDGDRFVYLLGQMGDGWRVVGFYYPEASNPE